MLTLHRNYTKETLKLALPVMLTQLGQASVQLFDNAIVGNLLGSNALASISLANGLFFAIFVFGIGLSFAIPPLVSEAHSQKDHQRISAVFRHGFVINMSVGILLTIIIVGIIPLLPYMKQPPEILPDTIDYLSVMAMSLLPIMAFQTLREMSEGLGYTVAVTKATVIANIINIVLNYTFIKGLFFFPEMGVKGSAYATLIARIFMLVFLYIVLSRHSETKRYIQYFTLKINQFQKAMFAKMLKLGFPTALQMFFEVTAFAMAAFICGRVSAHDVASHQIALTMASFTFHLCTGFSVASTILVGRKFGERNYPELRKIGINSLKLAFLYMAFCGIVFIIGRNYLPNFFTKKEDVEVIQLAAQLLIVAALFQLSDGIQVTAVGVLRGIQDVKIPSILTFIAYWVVTIPAGYILCVVLEMGALGMWIALGSGLTISAVLLVARFLKLSKR